MSESACPVEINDVPCSDRVTWVLTGMCVHEHLHKSPVCGWHTKQLAAMDLEDELLCAQCRDAGEPGSLVRLTFKRLELA
jgi:hypothetical protein